MTEHNRTWRSARPVAQLRQGRNDWYRIENNLDGGLARIYVYDEIGFFGVTAQAFVGEVAALNVGKIDLHLNSPGGDYFDGVAIYNALRAHPAEVTVHVDGLAASAASVIAMAGDWVVMGTGAQLMIHDALSLAVGNAADMRQLADLLDKCSQDIAAFYARKAGGDVEVWRDRMRAETWYNADEAVAAGLADTAAEELGVGETLTVAASWAGSLLAYAHAGHYAYAGREHAPAPDVSRETPGGTSGNVAPPDPAPVAVAVQPAELPRSRSPLSEALCSALS